MPRKLPIFYSALLLTGVNLLLRLAATSFQVYISGRLGAAGVGLLQLVMSVGMLATTAGIAGIRTATMYLTAEELGRKHPENVHWVLRGTFLYSILASGVLSLGLSHFSPWIAEHWVGDVRTLASLRTFAAFLPIVCLCGCMTGYFTAANRISTLAAVEIAEQLCSMAVTMGALTLWAGSDPGRACQSVVLGNSIGNCLTLLCLLVLRRRERPPCGPRLPIARRILQTAVPLALADDMKAGISTLENLMVPKRLALFSPVANPLAAFGLVCGMVFPVLMFPAAILFALAELLIPELARCSAAGSQRRIRYLVRRCLRFALLYGCLCGGLLFLLAEQLCLWLYDSPQAGEYLRLYAALAPMLYCDAITDAMTKGLGQQKVCVRYNILTSAMDVTFLYFLLPKHGMHGYFFSFLVTHLVNFLLSIRLLLKITGIAIPFYRPALTIAVTLFSAWLANFAPMPPVQAAGFLGLLGSTLFLLKIIRKEDFLWIRGLFRQT